MNAEIHPSLGRVASFSAVAIAVVVLCAADAPEPPKVSSFAPAAVLVKQVDYYMGRMGTALADKPGYDEGKQGRVRGDANLLVVLFMSLGLHDEENPLKKSAAGLVPLAQALFESATDYDKAQAAYAALAKAIKDGAPEGPPLKWEKRYKLGLLMKQVTAVNGQMRRIVKEASFNKDADKVAGYAAVLAIIGQATLVDTHEVKNPDQVGEWYRLSAEFRDAAGAVGAAAGAKDFKAADTAVKRVATNCDDCHAIFRKEAK